MKLKDLVVSSFRMQRRKKKTAGTGVTSLPEVTIRRQGLGKSRTWLPSIGAKIESRDHRCESERLENANWQGNELYCGPMVTSAAGIACMVMPSAYAPEYSDIGPQITGKYSELSTQACSCESEKVICDNNESDPGLSLVSDSYMESCVTQHHCCHCHKRYHHHHQCNSYNRNRAMSTIIQNQQRLSPKAGCTNHAHSYKTQDAPKSEAGFFRKSLASFRSMRKHSKASKTCNSKETSAEPMTCTLCPYSESTPYEAERVVYDGKHARTKRKGLSKFSSKSKENKDMIISSSCYSRLSFLDNDSSCSLHAVIDRENTAASKCSSSNRSLVRECSFDSRSSGLYDSLENSSVGDADISGFDSASLSGYDSDLSRTKVHRSRSRIKTNPWLPSPQPSFSGRRCGRMCDLRESKEEEYGEIFRPATCFEHQEDTILPNECKKWVKSNSMHQSRRFLAPVKTAHLENPSTKKPVHMKKGQVRPRSAFAPCNKSHNPMYRYSALNDLNTEYTKSRPTPVASPNVEFVKITDNLKQLASNISAEYEETTDLIMTNAAGGQESYFEAVKTFAAEDNHGSFEKKFLKSSGVILLAHSPDSGIGGTGSTDGDVNLTPQNDVTVSSMDFSCSSSQTPLGNNCGRDSSNSCCLSSTSAIQDTNVDMLSLTSQSQSFEYGYCQQLSDVSRSSIDQSQVKFTEYKYKNCQNTGTDSELNHYNTLHEDIITGINDQHGCSIQYKKFHKADTRMSSKKPVLMVKERLDTAFQPPHVPLSNLSKDGESEIYGHVRCSGSQSKQTSENCHWSHDALSCRIPRPRYLKYKPYAQSTSKKVKNIEKISESLESEKYEHFIGDFDFPWNITVSDCLESPVENGDCVGQFLVVKDEDNIINQGFHQIKRERSFQETYESIKNRNEVKAPNHIADYTFSPIETECHDTHFEMIDACVQTDFDDDCEGWDEIYCLEEDTENLVESARFWLQSGNMLGSANIGCSNKMRNSPSQATEKKMLLCGDNENRTAAEGYSCVDNSHLTSKMLASKHSVDLGTGLYNIISSPGYDNADLENSAHYSSVYEASRPRSINRHYKINKQSYEAACQPVTAITLSTESLIFSNIESQFQEIFHDICNPNAQVSKSNTARNSLASSTEAFSTFDDLTVDILPNSNEVSSKRNSSETTKSRESSSPLFDFTDKANNHSIDDNYFNMNSSHCDELNVKILSGNQPHSLSSCLRHCSQIKGDNPDSFMKYFSDSDITRSPTIIDNLYGYSPTSHHQHPESFRVTTCTELLPVNIAVSTSTHQHPLIPQEEFEGSGATSRLAKKVLSLRREKDLVFHKIREAQQDVISRQERRMEIQRSMYAQRKEALLGVLQDLRIRLETQSRRLIQPDSYTGGIFDL